jgi:uncharacterized delta-60 repeat protein
MTFTTQAQTQNAGTVDATFNPPVNNVPQVGPNGMVYCSVKQGDKILIGGDFTSYNGVTRNYIVRLNVDGTLDESFNANLSVSTLDGVTNNGKVCSISFQSNGNIIISGRFIDNTRKFIARLDANGTLDATFTGTTNRIVNTTAIQSDDKILIGGDFREVNSVSRMYIARLDANGTTDATFTGTTDEIVNTIVIQRVSNEDKILIGGSFNKGIARLNTIGTLDNSFITGNGTNSTVYTIVVQSNKILIGGSFSSYKGSSYVTNGIIRLNTDGTTTDTNFDPQLGKNAIVYSISTQPDGKIVLGGDFTSYNGQNIKNIIRLDATGTFNDSRDFTKDSFNNKVTLNGVVRTTLLQGDNVIIGGDFTTPKKSIIRLYGSDVLSTSSFDKKSMKIYPNPVRDMLNISMVDNLTIEKVTIVDMTGKVVLEQTENLSSVNVDRLSNGVYILTAYNTDKKYQTRFIKE